MSEAPERIYMDPNIRFPECEKQYGCDIEYIRGDLVEAIVKKLGDSLVVAEAKLAKAEEALERIGKGEFAGQMITSLPPQDATAHFARMKLSVIKRKGETDE
ncbi:MAG: hypothetical protein GY820_34535 [Gammaproteobacteria bacterium]|nr:hypothetical protein [Gammaproteobacteria bacterium]